MKRGAGWNYHTASRSSKSCRREHVATKTPGRIVPARCSIADRLRVRPACYRDETILRSCLLVPGGRHAEGHGPRDAVDGADLAGLDLKELRLHERHRALIFRGHRDASNSGDVHGFDVA